jgi:hypothetical protein
MSAVAYLQNNLVRSDRRPDNGEFVYELGRISETLP